MLARGVEGDERRDAGDLELLTGILHFSLSDHFCCSWQQAHSPQISWAELKVEQGQGGAICQAEVVAAFSSFLTNSVRSEPHPSPGLSNEHRLPSAAAIYRCSPHPRWRGRAPLICRRCAFRHLKSKIPPGNKQSLGLSQ